VRAAPRHADREFRAGDGVEDSEPIITKIEVVDWKREDRLDLGEAAKV
jgi:hypothetical protein